MAGREGGEMRPIYETTEDLKNERDVADYLSSIWGCEFVKLKISYGLDFAVVKGNEVVSVAEVKCRNYTSDQIDRLGGLMLSASKAHRAGEWMNRHEIQFLLIAKLKDGLFISAIEDWSPYDVKIAGRTDRGDWQDVEPCCMIPMSEFKKMEIENDPAS
jgi:hypothetical protein